MHHQFFNRIKYLSMKRHPVFIALLFMLFALGVSAQSTPIGVWKTIDDKTGEPKSHIQIYEKNGMFYGKIIKLLPAATTDICINCPGDKKDKSLIGLDILWDLKPYKDYWSYGHIVDPANGKVYKSSIWLDGPDKLMVRGYIGFSLIGRNQTWHRVKE